jgi:hypothetical protein
MKSFTFWLLNCVTLSMAAGANAQRTPLAPVDLTKIEYPPGGTRERLNPKIHRMDKYDLNQKIVYDERTGDFLLQWNGLDGKRKTIIYRPANRLHAVITAQVERDPAGRGFRYVYALRNLPNSQRELQTLMITTSAEVSNAGSPDSSWYSRPFTDYFKRTLAVPGGWTWSQTEGQITGLAPSETAYGFAFHSTGLPAPMRSYVNRRPGMKGVGEDPPEELMAALDSVTWLIPKGVTVSPVAPPEKLDPAKFLKDIEGMLETASQQGWILSPPLAKELQDSLARGVTVLQGPDSNAKRTALEAILKRVEEEKDKRLLSEAYAILKYNLEYLIPRL